MRLINILFSFFLLSIIICTSCTSYKKVTYMDGAAELSEADLAKDNNVQTVIRIMPKDILTIVVSAPGNEMVVLPFNLTIPSSYGTQTTSLYTQPTLQNYIVDENGMINFPKLGLLQVGNKTKSEVEQMIAGKLNDYLKTETIVTIRFVNFRVSVLGEVVRPGSINVTNERITILEALAQAGDMTIYGKRDNVLLIREDENGVKKYIKINLQDKYLVSSPYYYLRQNDVLYVQPNKTRANASGIGAVESMALSGFSILISMVNLLVNILR